MATEKGFVNGNQDSTTGLVNIGAREYDPVTGRFISIDPIVDVNDPQQMHGYAYANNNPTSFSDPDGLKLCSDDACGPGADFVDTTGKYHDVPGHNDGCGGCSGAYDPDVPQVSNPRNTDGDGRDAAAAAAAAAERARQAKIAKAKQEILNAAKALADIAMQELGITDALNCLTKGDMGGCLSTAIDIATTFVGGVLTKLVRKYGVPWKWEKGAALAQRINGLLGKLINGVKNFFKCHSFAPGTLVLMANGSKQPIEELEEGEEVLATDPNTGKTEARAVTDTHTNHDTELTDLTLAIQGGRDRVVKTTQHHPFWSQDRNGWVDAANLRVGERLWADDRVLVTVASVASYVDAKVMHDLTVDTIHTYYVLAGNTPVLVHNCGGATFVADASGTVVPTSASRLESGLQAAVDAGEAGFSTFPTRSAGTGFQLPDGSRIRIMQPSANGNAGLRASFTNGADAPVSPFTGRPVQPPRGVNPKPYVRSRTHIELEP